MRLLMLGTGPFAVPTFLAICESRHAMAAVVTGPLRAHHGRTQAPGAAIREVAQRRGLPLFDPENINAADSLERLAQFAADLMVVCDYGQILSSAALACARRGGVNLHAALLPKYRGAAPIQWAVYRGETETGLTVIHMTPELDAGPCIAQRRAAIGPDETAAELEVRLAQMGADLVCETLDRLERGEVQEIPQDPRQASRAPRLKKSDGRIDWTRPAEAIRNQVRALEPWPKTFSHWLRPGGSPMRLIFGPISGVENASGAAPGEVIEAAGSRLVVAAGLGAVMPASVQPAGKRAMSVEEFLRGHRVRPGDRMGDEEIRSVGRGAGDGCHGR